MNAAAVSVHTKAGRVIERAAPFPFPNASTITAMLTNPTPTRPSGVGHSPAAAAASGNTSSTDDARVIG